MNNLNRILKLTPLDEELKGPMSPAMAPKISEPPPPSSPPPPPCNTPKNKNSLIT